MPIEKNDEIEKLSRFILENEATFDEIRLAKHIISLEEKLIEKLTTELLEKLKSH